jgi:hypothetical protein
MHGKDVSSPVRETSSNICAAHCMLKGCEGKETSELTTCGQWRGNTADGNRHVTADLMNGAQLVIGICEDASALDDRGYNTRHTEQQI